MNAQLVIQSVLAVLMAVPLHLCCWSGMMQATEREEEMCPACRAMVSDAEAPATPANGPDPERHCACCDDTLLRDVSPAAITAPRAVVLELPSLAWLPPTALALMSSQVWHEQQAHLHAQGPPLAQTVPLFRLHGAWLL